MPTAPFPFINFPPASAVLLGVAGASGAAQPGCDSGNQGEMTMASDIQTDISGAGRPAKRSPIHSMALSCAAFGRLAAIWLASCWRCAL